MLITFIFILACKRKVSEPVLPRKRPKFCNNENHSDDEIEFDQFLHLLTSSKCWGKHEKDDLRNIFDLFDKQATGYISLDDLKKIATDLGETMTQEELQEMIERANPKEEGKVSPEEFYAIMTKKLFT